MSERQKVDELRGNQNYWEEVQFVNENTMYFDKERLSYSSANIANLKAEYDRRSYSFNHQSGHDVGLAIDDEFQMKDLARQINEANEFVKNYTAVREKRLLSIAKAKTELKKIYAQLDDFKKITDEFV